MLLLSVLSIKSVSSHEVCHRQSLLDNHLVKDPLNQYLQHVLKTKRNIVHDYSKIKTLGRLIKEIISFEHEGEQAKQWCSAEVSVILNEQFC